MDGQLFRRTRFADPVRPNRERPLLIAVPATKLATEISLTSAIRPAAWPLRGRRDRAIRGQPPPLVAPLQVVAGKRCFSSRRSGWTSRPRAIPARTTRIRRLRTASKEETVNECLNRPSVPVIREAGDGELQLAG
jgi:hypothetical protein